MKLSKENVSRKIDSLGRLSIPKSIRDRLEIKENDIVDFFLLEDNDIDYVCFTKHIEPVEKSEDIEAKKAEALKLLAEMGIPIPRELL